MSCCHLPNHAIMCSTQFTHCSSPATPDANNLQQNRVRAICMEQIWAMCNHGIVCSVMRQRFQLCTWVCLVITTDLWLAIIGATWCVFSVEHAWNSASIWLADSVLCGVYWTMCALLCTVYYCVISWTVVKSLNEMSRFLIDAIDFTSDICSHSNVR